MITAEQLVRMILVAETDEFGNVDVKGDPSRGTVWHKIGEPKGGKIPGKWGNKKIGRGVYILGDTPAGICPGAAGCKARFIKRPGQGHGKVVDFPGQKYRCFSAMDERWPEVAKQRWKNFNLLRGRPPEEIAEIVLRSIPPDATIVRVKEGGDFMTQAEFDGWMLATKSAPEVLFYAYTKSLPFWIRRRDEIPENFKLIASYGGKWDALIDDYGLRSVRIVDDAEEAERLGLSISSAWDDKTAYTTDKSFAILVHGSQKAGTDIAKKTMARSKHLAKIKPKSRLDFPDVQKRLADLKAMAHPTTLESVGDDLPTLDGYWADYDQEDASIEDDETLSSPEPEFPRENF